MKLAIIIVFTLLTALPFIAPKEINSPSKEASSLDSIIEITEQRTQLQQTLDAKTLEFTKGLDDEGNVLFTKSAVAWHVYAQSQCAVEADMFRNSDEEAVDLGRVIEENCYNRALSQRVAEVETLIRAYESP
jgi:hypothetical protein